LVIVRAPLVLAAPLAAGAHESEPTARSRHAPTRNPRRSPASDGGEVPYRPKAAQLAGKARPSAFAYGDHVVGIGTLRIRGKGSGAEVVVPTAVVLTFAQGKVVRFEKFGERARALEAAGLTE
jgi:ketosteroid isomerase-like protein